MKAKSSIKPQIDKNEALLKILRKRKRLTPETVVEEARNPKHPLHSLFCWDDTEAAKKYREIQAAHLIRQCRVEITPAPESETVTVRAFVNVRDEDEGETNLHMAGHYVPTGEAIKNPIYREQVIAQALRDLEAFENKYKAFEFLANAVSKVTALAKILKSA